MNNYSNMYQSETGDDIYKSATFPVTSTTPFTSAEPAIEEESEVTIVTPEPEPEPVIGVVVNCNRLNVRVEPDPTAKVACTIVNLDEVEIDEENSTSEFYKVYTAAGIDGYCMKKYIAIGQ